MGGGAEEVGLAGAAGTAGSELLQDFESGDDVESCRGVAGQIRKPADHRGSDPARDAADRIDECVPPATALPASSVGGMVQNTKFPLSWAATARTREATPRAVSVREPADPYQAKGASQSWKRTMIPAFQCAVRMPGDQHHPDRSDDIGQAGQQADGDVARHAHALMIVGIQNPIVLLELTKQKKVIVARSHTRGSFSASPNPCWRGPARRLSAARSSSTSRFSCSVSQRASPGLSTTIQSPAGPR